MTIDIQLANFAVRIHVESVHILEMITVRNQKDPFEAQHPKLVCLKHAGPAAFARTACKLIATTTEPATPCQHQRHEVVVRRNSPTRSLPPHPTEKWQILGQNLDVPLLNSRNMHIRLWPALATTYLATKPAAACALQRWPHFLVLHARAQNRS